MITMGNFFSGSGTWELAAKMVGMQVLWESEIEPFPVELEAKRFPEAIQLGDIQNVSGYDIPPVDVMTNSSPCQDLSVAGKRAGLDGERSSLFNEVIRITKEMRENGRKPRFYAWENVPGAFSSNGGADFQTVLTEVAKIVEDNAYVPKPEKWSYSGCLDGDGWQIAWRTLDAQYFGVPQRRRRVFLVADFDGHCAAEILFKRESVSWNFTQIAEAWKDTSRSLEERIAIAGELIGRPDGESVGRVGDVIGFDAYNQASTGDVTKPLTSSATDTDHTPVAFVGESQKH